MSAERHDITEIEVLESILEHLQGWFNLPEERCYEVVDPENPRANTPGDIWLSVCPGDCDYDEAAQAGGGRQQVHENGYFQITGYTRIKLDRAGKDTMLIKDKNRGLLSIKHRIISAFVQFNLTTAGRSFLMMPPVIISCTKPQHDPEKGVGWITATFRLKYPLKLTSDGNPL